MRVEYVKFRGMAVGVFLVPDGEADRDLLKALEGMKLQVPYDGILCPSLPWKNEWNDRAVPAKEPSGL